MGVLAEVLASVDPKDSATQAGYDNICSAIIDPQRTLSLQPCLILLSSLWGMPGTSDLQRQRFSRALKYRIHLEIQRLSPGQEGRQSDHASQLGVFHAVHESALEGGLPLEAFHAAALLKELPKLPNGGWDELSEQEEDVLLLASCLLTQQFKLQDLSLSNLSELHAHGLRLTQDIQTSILGSLSTTAGDETSGGSTVELPSLNVISAILHIVSRTSLYLHQAGNTGVSGVTATKAHLSESLSRHSGEGRASSPNTAQRERSSLQSRSRTRELSRQAAEQSFKRLRHHTDSADTSSLGKGVDVLLALLEACLAFCWSVNSGRVEGRYILKTANLTLRQLRPLLGVWTASSPDETLSRVHAALSSAAQLVQPDQSGAEHSEVNGTTSVAHESKYMKWALPSQKPSSLSESQQLCRGLLEITAKCLVPIWQTRNTLAMESIFIPLADMSHQARGDDLEHQVLLILLAYLMHATDGEESLSRVIFPLLSEAASQSKSPDTAACAFFALAECGKIAAVNSQRWGFEQTLLSLIASFQTANKQQGEAAERSCTLVSEALTSMAGLPNSTPHSLRQEVELKLLSLFADIALLARSESQLRCLGMLLLPLARVWGDGSPSSRRSLMSTGSMDFETLKNLRFDTQLTKLYRILWVYIAVHGFASTQSKQGRTRWPSQWREAAVLLAQGPTPLLVAGGEMDVFQVEAELGERVQRLSKIISPIKVAARLLDGIRSGQTLAPGLVATATHPARNAHLFSTLALNLLRVEVATVPRIPTQCPLAPLFATQQVASSKDWESDWLAAITERCFNVYLANLRPNPAIQGSDAGMLSKRLIMLASTLLKTLSDTSHNADARDLANKLLERLLRTFPSLTWDADLLTAFLTSLDAPVDCDYPVSPDARITVHLRRMIERGMVNAPNATEALLCEYLRLEPSKANGQSLKEAQNLLMKNHDQLQNQVARIEGPPSGLAAWRKKDKYMGITLGSSVLGGSQTEISQDYLMQNALSEFRKAASLGSSTALQSSTLVITGLLLRDPTQRYRREAVHLVASLPGQHLRTSIVRNAVFAWHWIIAAAPQLRIALLEEVVNSWLNTVRRRRGLFDTLSVDDAHTEPDLDVGEMLDEQSSEESNQTVDSLIAHHVWLDFLREIWLITAGSSSPDSAAIATLYGKLLTDSLSHTAPLTQQPAAAGTTFKLLSLGLAYIRYLGAQGSEGSGVAADLFGKVLKAAFHWFNVKPAYYGEWNAVEKWVEYGSVESFSEELDHVIKPFGSALQVQDRGAGKDKIGLLRHLLQDEADRLKVWANPQRYASKHGNKLKTSAWKTFATTAWQHDPSLAINLLARFPHAEELRRTTGGFVAQNAASQSLQASPKAAELLAQSTTDPAVLANLKSWAPGELLQSLHLMSSPCGKNPVVREYALSSLHTCDPDQVAFFLSQLVQLLRSDENGMTEKFLLESAGRTVVFAHHLICTLRSEGTPPEEAFNPTVKRSGWSAPEDTGLWRIADEVEKKVWAALNEETLAYLKAELDFFDDVTNVSGKLYPVPKDERKSAAVNFVREITVPRSDLYLPTNPASRVVSVIAESATPMQSAAKVPILVAFKVVDEKESPDERPQALIFKVGDDCRQDVLALQVIALLKNAFQKSGLDLYVAPYGVLPTTYERGIVEVVPNSESRSALGETSDGGLLEIWQRKFGASGSPSFQKAVRNFIKSEAGYAIACYLLQAKDRHNGNILVDNLGHLVHIDFGFILEISPGGNLGFESAAFKLSHEMTQLLDPSGNRTSSQFRTFQDLCIRGYLAARTVAEGIIATVQLMSESGLPCYGRGAPIANLRKRFHLEMSDAQAAAFMQNTINDAYDKWTTGFYDYVQYLQNSIPK